MSRFTLKKPNFPSFSELGKTWHYSLNATLKSYVLSLTVENEIGNLHKAFHIFNITNETFHCLKLLEFINELGKMFSIGKNRTLSPLRIQRIPQN